MTTVARSARTKLLILLNGANAWGVVPSLDLWHKRIIIGDLVHMANFKNRMRTYLFSLYDQGKGMKRKDDPDYKYIHSNLTLHTYLREINRFADWLQSVGVKSRCSEEEATEHIQEYIDHLVARGLKATSIHTAVAAVCKALNQKMGDYDKPPRTDAPTKGRNIAPSLAGRKDADPNNEDYRRLVAFAKKVGVRRGEYVNLLGRDIIDIDNDTYVFVEKGKGGKKQLQKITPEDAAFIKSYFDGIGSGERVFSEKEMKNKLNLHAYRRIHVQELYQQYVDKLETVPGYREELIQKLREAFERAGEDWRTNFDMQRLGSTYYTRRAVRQSLINQGLPTAFNRLALMAVSVFNLSHWRTEVTIKNYMQ